MIDLYSKVVANRTGLDDRLCMLMEECGELIQAANKIRREVNKYTDIEEPVDRVSGISRGHIIEEMVDVASICEQLEYILDISEDEKNHIKAHKQERTLIELGLISVQKERKL